MHLKYFARRPPGRPEAILRDLLAFLAPDTVTTLSRTLKGDREWKMLMKHQRLISRNSRRGHATIVSGAWLDQFNPSVGFYEKSEREVAKVPGEYRKRQILSVGMVGGPVLKRMDAAILTDVPSELRGEARAGEMFLQVGKHDVIDYRNDVRRIGKAVVSLKFGGHGDPLDYAKAPAAILDAPGVRAVKAEIEQITGPLREHLYWL